jgi:hypothetical protein
LDQGQQSLQPRRGLGKAFAKRIGYLTTDVDFLDASQLGQCFGLWTWVINGRDLADVTVIDTLDKLIDENVAQEIFDGLVVNFGVLDGNGALKDTNMLGIPIEDSLDILGLPEWILRYKMWVMVWHHTKL